MKRREFIGATLLAGAGAMTGGCKALFDGAAERVPYGDTIGDRLWMWGHHAMAFASLQGNSNESYNLPYDRRIDMADACKDMGIPGCFVVRWLNLPTKEELPSYMKQFAGMKRVGFSITDSAKETFDEKVRLGLEFADRMPNLTTLILDDYWRPGHNQGHEALVRVKERLASRRLKLSAVLYSDADGVKGEFKRDIDLCDEITFWFWHGENVDGIEGQVAKLRELVGPEKPILLGQYMWDFGGRRPMSAERMESQLAQTTRLLDRREISGVIFHCTPLVDMDIDAVNISRRWIRENAPRRWGA